MNLNNITDAIIEFEEGNMERDDTLELFQHLVDTGLAWHLQGSYGRAAASLLDQGLIRPPHGKLWIDGRLEDDGAEQAQEAQH